MQQVLAKYEYLLRLGPRLPLSRLAGRSRCMVATPEHDPVLSISHLDEICLELEVLRQTKLLIIPPLRFKLMSLAE
jgi:hypothetical protein